MNALTATFLIMSSVVGVILIIRSLAYRGGKAVEADWRELDREDCW